MSTGANGRSGTRNTPSLSHRIYEPALLWDGRRNRLESQVLAPFTNRQEHGLESLDEVVSRIGADDAYGGLFRRAYGASVATAEYIARALATFVRSLAVTGSAFDRYVYRGESSALGESARRGLEVFRGRGRCDTCHSIGPDDAPLTDHGFHSAGIAFDRLAPQLASLIVRVAGMSADAIDETVTEDATVAALGRYLVTRNSADIGKFRTPSLRNVALTAPYMHDGSVATLAEAVEQEVYYRGVASGRALNLTLREKADLVAFLEALTDAQFDGAGNHNPTESR